MTVFELTAVLMAFVGVAGWINIKTFHLPHGVAMLLAGLAAAIVVSLSQWLVPEFGLAKQIVVAVNRIDFVGTVVGYMLAFLLFAGAMQVDLAEMRRRWVSISALATLGVAGSIVVVGFGLWSVAALLGIDLPLIWALLFGALISPTDPVAVLATVRHVRLSKTLTVILQGEALFNDGVGIVAFTALLAIAMGTGEVSAVHTITQVLIQALGGLALGITMSWLTIQLMKRVDDFAVETSLTIALAMGAYSLAEVLHLSGAIAVVGAGMLFGGPEGRKAIEGETKNYLTSFWILVDEVLNAVLFLLLGVEIMAVPFEQRQFGLLLSAIPLVLLARFVVVQPWAAIYRFRDSERGPGIILGWGGLHGALSLALALTLPPGPNRSLVLSITYVVVAFSIVVQGLTLTPIVRWIHRRSKVALSDAH